MTASGLQPVALPWQEEPAINTPVLTWCHRLGIFWERSYRWEFWPSRLYCAPIVLWILLLGLKHRNPTAFTAANPGLESGGMVGE